jgi:hypothetical protein
LKSGVARLPLLHKAKPATYPYPPHRRDFKDCQQILEDSLTPSLHIKARARLHKSRLAKLLEKSESEDFSMLIDNQCITR